jgi:hypothetical protein
MGFGSAEGIETKRSFDAQAAQRKRERIPALAAPPPCRAPTGTGSLFHNGNEVPYRERKAVPFWERLSWHVLPYVL